MTSRQPAEPDRSPLRPEAAARHPGSWLVRHVAGLIALVIGAVGFVVVSVIQDQFWSQPDWRITVPLFAATVVAATVSLVRREDTPLVPLLGVGLAAVTLVLGWFLVMAGIVLVTALLILILSAVM